MRNDTAGVVEIFSSIQGEGVLIGCRQVFIRFQGCNLDCAYCDTDFAPADNFCRMELTPGRLDFELLENPVDLKVVLALVERWQHGWPKIHHSVSLTGGEPLLQVDLLHDLLPRLRHYLPVYLETNGTLHSALERVVKDIDYISMDIKLPSSSGEQSLWDHHRDFLRVAAGSNVSIKVVVNDATEHWEIERAAMMIAAVDPRIPLILQPETAANLSVRIAPRDLISLQEIASTLLDDVRIIPQTHRFIGML